jgi:hypothetical protein
MPLKRQPTMASRRPRSHLTFTPSMRSHAGASFHGILWSLQACRRLTSSGRSPCLRKRPPEIQRSRGWHGRHLLRPIANLSTRRSLTQCTRFRLPSLGHRPRHSSLNLRLNPRLSLNPHLSFNLRPPSLNKSHNPYLYLSHRRKRHGAPLPKALGRRLMKRMRLSLLRVRPAPCGPKPPILR